MGTDQVEGSDVNVPQGTVDDQAGVAPNDGSQTQTTPSTEPVDGGTQPQQIDWQARYNESVVKGEQDLSKLKSSLQSSHSREMRTLQEQLQDTQRQLEEVQMRGMNDEERAQFQQVQQQRQSNAQLQAALDRNRQLEQQIQVSNWVQFYADLGVDPAKLVKDQGPEALSESGWTAVRDLIADLKAKAAGIPAQQTQQTQQVQPSRAQQVASGASGVPYQGPSWNDLVKRFGSDEEVFRAIESGQIKVDIDKLSPA